MNNDDDQFGCENCEDCDCNTMNWPKAVSHIVGYLCLAAIIIAAFKFC
ncbi:MAG: hypothetical protein ACXAC5_04640 [Promethearchaeota archaeon]|jgi:hypothetical protein